MVYGLIVFSVIFPQNGVAREQQNVPSSPVSGWHLLAAMNLTVLIIIEHTYVRRCECRGTRRARSI